MAKFLGFGAWFTTLLRKLLHIYVRTDVIGADREHLELDPDKPVCYVLQYSSLSSRLVLEQTVLDCDLPSSQQPLGPIGLKRSFVFLYQRQGGLFRRRHTPAITPRFRQLVEAATSDPEQDIQIVPVSLFWGRTPDKEKSLLKILLSDTWAVAGRLQKFLIILVHGRSTFVQFNRPFSLHQIAKEFPDNKERATRKLARVLRVHFRRVRRTVIGPDLSHRRTLVHAIIRSQSVREAIEDTAKREKIPREKARRYALRYGREIASNFSMVTIRVMEVLLAWLWNRIYNGVSIKNIDIPRDVAKDSAVVYVPCHRSHIDYLLLSYVLYRNGLTPPHIAAGINLNMPIVGPILRRGGAFFMRRSFKNNPLYATVFNEYMHMMFARGYSVEYFVEGGRSRTGRTLQPRAGMLNMTVRSFLRDDRKPIVFIPVYIGYEKVMEARSYLGELQGSKKKNESILGLFRSLKNLRKSFGRVSVNFGEPINLRQTLDEVQPGWDQEQYDESYKPRWLNQAVDRLADNVATGINAAAAVNPVNLLALILLATERLAMDERMLSRLMDDLCRLLEANPYSDTMSLPKGNGSAWVKYGEEMGLIQRQKQKLGDIITVEGNNAILLTYYRNNIQHLFALPALIACLFQNNSTLDRDRIVFLVSSIYPYIQSELFLRWTGDEVEPAINRWIDVLVEQDLLTQQGQIVYRPVPGSEQAVRLRVLSRCIIQTLERYFIGIAVLRKNGPGKISAQELEEQSTQMAQRMSILFGLNAPEFFDKSLFRKFIANLKAQETVTTNAEGKLEYTTGLDDVAEDARLVLSSEMRQSILQVTQLGG